MRILHYADVQVKDEGHAHLRKPTSTVLRDIEDIVRSRNIECVVIPGDLYEHWKPTEVERKMVYNHLTRLLSIDTLKELVLIDGNHDIPSDRISTEDNKNHTALSVLKDMVDCMGTAHKDKLRYFVNSGVYQSITSPEVMFQVFSLNDGTFPVMVDDLEGKSVIGVYHAMMREYALDKKIPLRQDVLNSLDTMDVFHPGSVVMAGDIHEPWEYSSDNGVMFHYPGSTQQHTHNEGNFAVFTNDKHDFSPTQAKQVLLHDVSGGKVSTSSIKLPARVYYQTVELDREITIESFKDNFDMLFDTINVMSETLMLVVMKVKSCTSLLSREMEIRDHIVMKFNGSKVRLHIEPFEYSKVVSEQLASTNKVVQEIMTGKDEHDDKEQQSSVDSLSLTNEQIIKLFKSVSCEAVKNLKLEDVRQADVLDILDKTFIEQLSITNTGNKRYSIELLEIQTSSGFMMLAPGNNITLDIPGLTRITGSNGLGKTTMYNMLRWAIKGVLYDWMKMNNMVRNTEPVFNNKVVGHDVADCLLNTRVNGTIVKIRRVASRTWKPSTTDKQKLSDKRMNHVASITRSLTLEIHKVVDGETRVNKITDDEAQNLINTWFGNVIDTITILDAPKLSALLKKEPDDLNSMVLDMVGVDYLVKLENNLPVVKNELIDMSVPKRKKDIIISERDSIKQEISDNNTRLTGIRDHIDESLKLKGNIEDELQSINGRLIDTGNIKLMIDDKEKEITVIDTKVDSFVTVELMTRDETVHHEPVKDVSYLHEMEANLKSKKALMDSLIVKVESSMVTLTKLDHDVLDSKSSCVNKLNNIIDNLTIKKDELLSSKISCFNTAINACLTIHDKFKQKQVDNNESISSINMTISNIRNDISRLEKSMIDGVCDKCGSILDGDKDTHEAHVIKVKSDIMMLEQTLGESISNVTKLSSTSNTISSYVTTYFNTILRLKDHDTSTLLDDMLILDRTGMNTVIFIDEVNRINHDIDNVTRDIMTCSTMIKDINNGIMIDSVDSIDIIKEEYDTMKSMVSRRDEYKVIHDGIVESTSNDKNKLLNDVIMIETNIKEFNDGHDIKVREYIDALNKQSEHNTIVDKHNHDAMESRMAHEVNIMQASKAREELVNLNGKLPFYLELLSLQEGRTNQLTSLNASIDQTNTLLISCNDKRVNDENKLLILDKEYNDYMEYQVKNEVYKVYSKLVTGDFKGVVFEYYRTFLNNTLNNLLGDVYFRLFWDTSGVLMHLDFRNGVMSSQPVNQSSGMESCFLALTLVYTMHLLNVKNSISHIFIDEISGMLNDGKGLKHDARNYKELLVMVLSKFTHKNVVIIDHTIEELFETYNYDVLPGEKGSVYIGR
jgi:DNA repair exonuclease SbcCD nuclease subunit